MLANPNKKLIQKLARHNLRREKRKYAILLFTIALSSFLLFSVFTIGLTYLDLSRLQDTRLNGARYDIALLNGFTARQKQLLENHPDVRTVGTESYAGYIQSTQGDDTVETGLLWCDDVFWNEQAAPARTHLSGSYPRKEQELLMTRDALKSCGLEELDVGDSFQMTYETNTGVHTGTFTISGIWDGYGDTSPVFVSRAFYEKSGYQTDYDGILCIELKQRFVTPAAIDRLRESLALSDRQSFQPGSYIEHSLHVLLGICGLCFFIVMGACLLIYNMMYLSVSGKIRYYGLLQALGMTRRQLLHLIRKQMLWLGAAGTGLGIALGVLTSFFLVPYSMKVFGISAENMEFHFHPVILLISVTVSALAVLTGIRPPLRMAARTTPVEAVRYQGGLTPARKTRKPGKRRPDTSRRHLYFWRSAWKRLWKDRSKTVIVLLSLATSLTVFYCLTTLVVSQGERTVMPAYWDADLTIRNATQIPEDPGSLQPAIDETMIAGLEAISGIRSIHVTEGSPVLFSDDLFFRSWLENYTRTIPYLSLSEVSADFQAYPEHYYGMLKGIDEDEFDYLNQLLPDPIDREDFLSGKLCLVNYAGIDVPPDYLNGAPITFFLGGRSHSIRIAAVSYEGWHSGTRNRGPNLLVSRAYLDSLAIPTRTLGVTIRYDKSFDSETEASILRLLEKSPYRSDLIVESLLESMETVQKSQGSLLQLGCVISLLLLVIGALNYANTMTVSIQNRRLTFAIMESVGMSRQQVHKLLIREGILYAVLSILITATAGTAVTYAAFQSMNYMGIPFHVPVLPLLGAAALVFFLCIVTPLFSYRKLAGKKAVAERLKEYE